MENFRQSLPPLDSLIAFEAAARLGNFTRAADALNVTQSAVSQQIKLLEARLGVALFDRGHRSVTLTAAGRDFENSVTVALGHLSAAAARLRSDAEAEPVTVSVDQSIAALWLPEQIRRVAERVPGLRVRIHASDSLEETLAVPFDLAILHGNGAWPGYESRMVIPETVFPVCAPDYLVRCPHASDPATLTANDLIDFEYVHWNWMNWTIFLGEADLAPLTGARPWRTNSYALALDWARRGLGVSLGWGGLVDEDLRAGRLVRPFETVIETTNGYHVLWRYKNPLSDMAVALRDAL